VQKIARLDVERLSYDEVEAGPVVAKTSDYSVLASDSGKLLVANKGGTFTFTLPAVAVGKGCVWDFIQLQDQNMVVTGTSTDVMVGKNSTGHDKVTFSTTSEKIGAACRIICDGTYYYFFNTSDCTATLSG